MASVEKFGERSNSNQLRHILRQVRYPANADIDSSRTHLNYSLSPDRDMAPADYLQKRLSQLHCMEREDVRTMCGWVITKPKDLPESEERRFFRLILRQRVDQFRHAAFGFFIGDMRVLQVVVHIADAGRCKGHHQ